MAHRFLNKSKFALATFANVYVNLPSDPFQLSDGTWVMPRLPVSDLSVWQDWIGSIWVERLGHTNLVLFVEESSENPETFDEAHQRLGDNLNQLFHLLHLKRGIEYGGEADLLRGSVNGGEPIIRQIGHLTSFYQSRGYTRAPITLDWLEQAVALRSGLGVMKVDGPEFRRVTRGLYILYRGLAEKAGQDRLHQFVRSLEALIFPDIGKTKSQFAHRCQTFAGANAATVSLLQEAFDMRSDTEHVHEWDEAAQGYLVGQREDVCWQRTRQIEQLACDAYSRLLRDAILRQYFETDATIAAFWGLQDHKRASIWGKPLDITHEPLVQKYDHWGRAVIS